MIPLGLKFGGEMNKAASRQKVEDDLDVQKERDFRNIAS